MISRALLSFTCIALLSGCATDVIRLDRAGSMTAAGQKATDSTMEFASRAIDANRDAMIEIVAFDPSCTIPEPLIAQGRVKPGQPPLCGQSEGGAKPLRYAARTRSDLAATAEMVEGIVVYLEAVDAVLGRESPDLAGLFADAQADLEAVRTILGADGTTLLNEDQSTAIGAALGLIQDLAVDAALVRDLRLLETKLAREETPVAFPGSACARIGQPAPPNGRLTHFAHSICGLKLANREWAAIYSDGLDDRLGLLNTAFRALPPSDPDTRRAAVRAQVELYESAQSVPKLRKAIDKLADDFAVAHSDYQDLLPAGSKAQLTDKEKARRARITRERVRAALRSLSSLVAAF